MNSGKKEEQLRKEIETLDAIVVQELTKRYGEIAALHGISLSVRKGEFFGFLGPNGAGKTTVRILTGILPPDAG